RDDLSGHYTARIPAIAGALTDKRSTHYDASDYYFGATYAAALGELRLGVSLFGVYSNLHSSIATSYIRQERNGSSLGQAALQRNIDTESFSLISVAGAQYSAGRFSLGAAISTPSIRISGAYRYSEDLVLGEGGRTIKQTITAATQEYSDGRPLRLNLGISF